MIPDWLIVVIMLVGLVLVDVWEALFYTIKIDRGPALDDEERVRVFAKHRRRVSIVNFLLIIVGLVWLILKHI